MEQLEERLLPYMVNGNRRTLHLSCVRATAYTNVPCTLKSNRMEWNEKRKHFFPFLCVKAQEEGWQYHNVCVF